ncbi:MAG: DNA recombination protein RmuC, partial [Candidatus Portiera sp.]|nr:DNA recombination protein RmuC [Portiera sp.]
MNITELLADLGVDFWTGVIIGGLAVAFISYVYSNKQRLALQEENAQLKGKLDADDGNLDKIKNIANQLMTEQAAQSNVEIKKTLDPLKENINSFKNRLEDLDKERAADNRAIKEHINTLNQRSIEVSEEAANLTNALRNDKTMQGSWGEVILERLLELS